MKKLLIIFLVALLTLPIFLFGVAAESFGDRAVYQKVEAVENINDLANDSTYIIATNDSVAFQYYAMDSSCSTYATDSSDPFLRFDDTTIIGNPNKFAEFKVVEEDGDLYLKTNDKYLSFENKEYDDEYTLSFLKITNEKNAIITSYDGNLYLNNHTVTCFVRDSSWYLDEEDSGMCGLYKKIENEETIDIKFVNGDNSGKEETINKTIWDTYGDSLSTEYIDGYMSPVWKTNKGVIVREDNFVLKDDFADEEYIVTAEWEKIKQYVLVETDENKRSLKDETLVIVDSVINPNYAMKDETADGDDIVALRIVNYVNENKNELILTDKEDADAIAEFKIESDRDGYYLTQTNGAGEGKHLFSEPTDALYEAKFDIRVIKDNKTYLDPNFNPQLLKFVPYSYETGKVRQVSGKWRTNANGSDDEKTYACMYKLGYHVVFDYDILDEEGNNIAQTVTTTTGYDGNGNKVFYVAAPKDVPKYEGHYFNGWKINDEPIVFDDVVYDGAKKVKEKNAYIVDENVVITADWVEYKKVNASITNKSVVYNKEHNYDVGAVVKAVDGTTLIENKDYEVIYNASRVGTGYATVSILNPHYRFVENGKLITTKRFMFYITKAEQNANLIMNDFVYGIKDTKVDEETKEICGEYVFAKPQVEGLDENPQITYYYKESTMSDYSYKKLDPRTFSSTSLAGGKYSLRVVAEATYDYNRFVATTEFEVIKAPITFTINENSFVFDGKIHNPQITTKIYTTQERTVTPIYRVSYVDMTYMKSSYCIDVGDYFAHVALDENSKKYYTIVETDLEENKHRAYQYDINLPFSIIKRDVTIKIAKQEYLKVYGETDPIYILDEINFEDKEKGIDLTKDLFAIEASLKVTREKGEDVNKGHHYKLKLEAANEERYKAATKNYNVTLDSNNAYLVITKKTIDFNIDTSPSGYIYDGTKYKPNISFVGLTGKEAATRYTPIEYKDYSSTYSDIGMEEINSSDETLTPNVGTKYVYVGLLGAFGENYKLKDEQTVVIHRIGEITYAVKTYDIVPAEVVLKVDYEQPYVYNGKIQTPTEKVEIINGELKGKTLTKNISYKVSYASAIPDELDPSIVAGSKTLIVELMGRAANNFKIVGKNTYEYEITKAQLTITINDAKMYKGKELPIFTSEIVGLIENDEISYNLISNGITTKKGTYPIVIEEGTLHIINTNYLDDYNNPYDVTDSYDVTVIPGTLTVKSRHNPSDYKEVATGIER